MDLFDQTIKEFLKVKVCEVEELLFFYLFLLVKAYFLINRGGTVIVLRKARFYFILL